MAHLTNQSQTQFKSNADASRTLIPPTPCHPALSKAGRLQVGNEKTLPTACRSAANNTAGSVFLLLDRHFRAGFFQLFLGLLCIFFGNTFLDLAGSAFHQV